MRARATRYRAAAWRHAARPAGGDARHHAPRGVCGDPCQPFEVIDELGISAVDFLAELATNGSPALLWYGFDHASRPTTHAQLRTVMDAARQEAVWCAEIVPSYLGDPRFPFHSGFVGCGLVGVNLSATAVRACATDGRGLERVYRDAVALGRFDGSLHYQQIA